MRHGNWMSRNHSSGYFSALFALSLFLSAGSLQADIPGAVTAIQQARQALTHLESSLRQREADLSERRSFIDESRKALESERLQLSSERKMLLSEKEYWDEEKSNLEKDRTDLTERERLQTERERSLPQMREQLLTLTNSYEKRLKNSEKSRDRWKYGTVAGVVFTLVISAVAVVK